MRWIPTHSLILNSYLSQISQDIHLNPSKSNDEIIETYGRVVGEFTEVQDIGSTTPEMLLLNLLVDDGDSNRSNRKNLMNKAFKIIGIYHENKSTTLTFTRRFFTKEEEIGELSDDNYDFTSYSNTEKAYNDEMQLDSDVIKEERTEKIIEEKGQAKRLIKIKKYLEDGSIKTDLIKEDI